MKDPLEPIREAPEIVQRVIREVLQLEREKLYQPKPRVLDEITRKVKGIVNEVDGSETE